MLHTRRLNPGTLFVALIGPRFDGHNYSEQAQQAGAVGILVNRKLNTQLPQIIVPDTQAALEKLAATWRRQLRGKVIAITGSNGKTTTKELIAKILEQVGPTIATRGNLNNAIGVPLTLLTATDQQFIVVEMGANHPGEIAALSAITTPDIAIITNAGRAHLEGFGSLAGVAKAKGEILTGVTANGTCILNQDDKWLELWQNLAYPRCTLTFSYQGQSDVAVETIEESLQLTDNGFHNKVRIRTPRGSLLLNLAIAGKHNLMNVLAAIAVAEALEIDHQAIQVGLQQVTPVTGRLKPVRSKQGAWLIDDTYNANPDSVQAGVAVLNSIPNFNKWLVLGDLGELGADAAVMHQDLGTMAKNAGVESLLAVGPLSAGAVTNFGANAQHFSTKEALIDHLRKIIAAKDLILVKGSRSAGMEQVVNSLITDTP